MRGKNFSGKYTPWKLFTTWVFALSFSRSFLVYLPFHFIRCCLRVYLAVASLKMCIIYVSGQSWQKIEIEIENITLKSAYMDFPWCWVLHIWISFAFIWGEQKQMSKITDYQQKLRKFFCSEFHSASLICVRFFFTFFQYTKRHFVYSLFRQQKQ